MTALFDKEKWIQRAKENLPKRKEDFKTGITIGISAAAFFPLLTALKDPALSFLAASSFGAIVSGLGSNLLAGEIQNWLSKDDLSIVSVEKLIQGSIDQNEEIKNEIDYVIKELQLIQYSEQKLSEEDKQWFKKTLTTEIEKNSHPILNYYTTENLSIEKIENANIIQNFGPDYRTFIEAYYRELSRRCQNLPLGTLDEQFINNQAGKEIQLNDIYTNLFFNVHRIVINNQTLSFLDKNNKLQLFYLDDLTDIIIGDPFLDKSKYSIENVISKAFENKKILRNQSLKFISLYKNCHGRFSEIDILKEEIFQKTIILGDPGSGKTTFINNLTFTILNFPETLPENIQNHILVRIILRDAAKYLRMTELESDPSVIWNVIKEEFLDIVGEDGGLEAFTDFKRLILKKPCLVLLDGLDEIPLSNEMRQKLINSIEIFIQTLQPSSRIILTMRPYAVENIRWKSHKFSRIFIRPFNEVQIKSFINVWYQTLKNKGLDWSADLIDSRKNELILEIFYRKYLEDLAKNPILLTIIATLHTNGGNLPEDRAALYENISGLLLSRWQLRFAKKNIMEEELLDINIRKLFHEKPDLLRSCMNKIAYHAHEKQYRISIENQSKVSTNESQEGEISRNDILQIFDALLPVDTPPKAVIEYISKRTGLLIARSNDVFVFPHKTFQEFLSACYISNQPESTKLLKQKLFEDFDWWKEVYLLAVGRKKNNFDDAINLITISLPIFQRDLTTVSISEWDIVLLATQALIDLNILNDRNKFENYHHIIDYIRSLLKFIISNQLLDQEKLIETGFLLSLIGDDRKGIGSKIINNKMLPDIDWVHIENSENYFYNSGLFPSENYEIENKSLNSFKISKYPITVQQFLLFIEDNGFNNSIYWDDYAWEFYHNDLIKAKISQMIFSYNPQLANDFNSHISLEKYQKKFLNIPKKYFNSPITDLSHYIVSAYFNWLSINLKIPEKIHLPNHYQVIFAHRLGKINSNFYNSINILPYPIGCFMGGGSLALEKVSTTVPKNRYFEVLNNLDKILLDTYSELIQLMPKLEINVSISYHENHYLQNDEKNLDKIILKTMIHSTFPFVGSKGFVRPVINDTNNL